MNKNKFKNTGLWILAVVITLAAVVFQRMTGPTHAKTIHFTVGGQEYTTRLPRSLTIPPENGSGENTPMHLKLTGLPENARVHVYARRFPTRDEWNCIAATREGERYTALLPTQPPAGKMAYYLSVETNGQTSFVQKDDPVMARFKNDVPAGFLIPHILLMFVAMLLSNLTGLLAFTKSDKFLRYAWITLICLGIGGLIFGPVIQKFAFGVYWSGWPFGSDLTDNKTMIAFIFWLIAIMVNRNKKRLGWGIAASVIMLLIYCIPHSTLGSEHDYTTGQLGTEKIK